MINMFPKETHIRQRVNTRAPVRRDGNSKQYRMTKIQNCLDEYEDKGFKSW
jgi:hypothetical protein